MVVAYLAFNAVLYAALGAWCALAPESTSAFLGLTLVGPAGRSEYLAVYGGLQLGFAAFFGLAVAAPRHRASALGFAALVYGGIVVLRTTAVVRFGFAALGNARFAYVLEIVLLAAALALLLRRR
jgi:hypothetical protein